MALDLNLLRKEFAEHLLDDHGRFSFDRALYFVLKTAYEAGQRDAAFQTATSERARVVIPAFPPHDYDITA